MGLSINTTLLNNCTKLTINKYPWVSDFNSSLIDYMNRTEVLDLIATILESEKQHQSYTVGVIREFLTTCLLPSSRRPFELPLYQKLIWTCFFGVMLLIAISGNIIVLWIVLAHRRMRTVTNYFLLNLSIADLLMSILNCVFNFIFMLNSDWPFGAVYCTINNFIANVSVAASVFTLVAISLDRYIAIVRPLQHRTSRKKARIFLLIIWLLSGILAAPCLMYSTTMTKKYLNGKRTVCYMLWPDGRYPDSFIDYIYNVVFLILTYVIPMLIMMICYSLMGRELWGSKSIGEHTERQMESMKSKKKVVRMFIIIVTIFAICWRFYWLAMSNTMVNPIIYYWMNGRFRVYFREVMCFCCLRMMGESITQQQSNRKGLNKKQSQSEMARSKSAEIQLQHIGCRGRSLNWRQSTEKTRLRSSFYRNDNSMLAIANYPAVKNGDNGLVNADHCCHHSPIPVPYLPSTRNAEHELSQASNSYEYS